MTALPNPVDRVEILTVVDNVLDLLLISFSSVRTW
jgi:hypothetical protein